MKEELILIAKMLMKMASRNERDVISQYVHTVNVNQLNTARILADEIMDYYMESDANDKKIELSTSLYDKTMEYYELNT